MTDHVELRPDDSALPLTLADIALRNSNMRLTYLTGVIAVDNGDGTETWIGGGENAGANGLVPWVGDTTPPGKPTGVAATSALEIVTVHWDGTLEGGVPADFDHVEVYAKPDSTGETMDLGQLPGKGELVTGRLPVGDVVEVWAVAYDNAHDDDGTLKPNRSEESDHATVIVVPVVSQQDLSDTADEVLAAAKDDAGKQVKNVSDGLAAARNDIDANAKKFTGTVEGAVIISSEFRDSETADDATVKLNSAGMYLGDDFAYDVKSRKLNINGAIQSGGELSGVKVTGSIVQTSPDDDTGVKLTSGGLAAYGVDHKAKFALKASDGSVTMDGPVITNGRITAAAFTGGEFTGGTFTGALIQSSASDKVGFKLNGGAFDFYDGDGQRSIHLDGSNNLMSGTFMTAMDGPRIEIANTNIDNKILSRMVSYDGQGVEWYLQGESTYTKVADGRPQDPGSYRRLNFGINTSQAEFSVTQYLDGSTRSQIISDRVDITPSGNSDNKNFNNGVYVGGKRIDPYSPSKATDFMAWKNNCVDYCGTSGKDPRTHMMLFGQYVFLQIEAFNNPGFDSSYMVVANLNEDYRPLYGVNMPCAFANGGSGGAFIIGENNDDGWNPGDIVMGGCSGTRHWGATLFIFQLHPSSALLNR